MNTLKHFILWLDVRLETVDHKKLLAYIDYLLDRGLQPKTINCHLDSIRGFYHYLIEEEQVQMVNPVKRGYALRLSRPLPRHLRDEEVVQLLGVIEDRRDRAMFMLMLRCGLRVEEVARLKLPAIDWRRRQLFVYQGKGAKDRVVYLSDDSYEALMQYLRVSCTIVLATEFKITSQYLLKSKGAVSDEILLIIKFCRQSGLTGFPKITFPQIAKKGRELSRPSYAQL